MVDYFSLALSHGILLLAFWRLMLRDDLDIEPPREETAAQEPSTPPPPPAKGKLRRA